MSAAHLPSFMHDQDVPGELLHSLSQPLTSLRCSLEMSLDDAAEPQQTSVVLALQQIEQVIGMVQLMREYLDAEQPGTEARRTSLDRVLRKVIEDLSAIAEVRGITLRLEGTCSATVALPEFRLRLALQYLGWAHGVRRKHWDRRVLPGRRVNRIGTAGEGDRERWQRGNGELDARNNPQGEARGRTEDP